MLVTGINLPERVEHLEYISVVSDCQAILLAFVKLMNSIWSLEQGNCYLLRTACSCLSVRRLSVFTFYRTMLCIAQNMLT